MSPFQALYGYIPPHRELITQESTPIAAVKDVLQRRVNMDHTLKKQLEIARHKMKQMTDKNRSEKEFLVGDLVFLKLQSSRQNNVALRKNLKLNPRYYGPYPIIRRIGMVAYELRLPEGSFVHLVLHISLLKKKIGDAIIISFKLPMTDKKG
jgi:hypothetical protein